MVNISNFIQFNFGFVVVYFNDENHSVKQFDILVEREQIPKENKNNQVDQVRVVKCHSGHRWRCTYRFGDCIRVLDWRHMDTESWQKKMREKEKF